MCGSQWDETGKREERKKSSVCCCSPALRAEIRLINSRDNVEMSSMTSILGAEAQQHHCAALQLALCWVNSGSPGRKELIDGFLQPTASVHCWASHTQPPHQQRGLYLLANRVWGVLVDRRLNTALLGGLRHWQTSPTSTLHSTTLTPSVFIGLWNKSLRFRWDDSCGWLSGLPHGRLGFHLCLMILQRLSFSHWGSVQVLGYKMKQAQFDERKKLHL